MSLYKDASLVMIPSAYKDGKLYSIRPTDGSGDFTFSRGSNLAATRVDVNGLIEKGRENLLLQSNQFDTTWLPASVSVTGGQAGYDGSNNAWLLEVTATGSYRRVYQSGINLDVNTFSIYAKANTSNFLFLLNNKSSTDAIAWFDLSDGSIGGVNGAIDTSIESVGNGWYRCSVTSVFADNQYFVSVADGISNVTGTTGASLYIQDAQLEQGLVATDYIETTTTSVSAGILEDMPRLDYSGGASCPSLLLEPQRSNLHPRSEYIDDWSSRSSVSNVVTTQNYTTSPEGVQNATRIEFNANGWMHGGLGQTNGTQYTISCYAKRNDSGSQTFALFINGSGGLDVPLALTNEWKRFDYTYTADNASTMGFAGASGADVSVYGFQVEQGSYPTSYIPTYGTSQTRSADFMANLDIPDFNDNTSFSVLLELTRNGISSSEIGSMFSFYNDSLTQQFWFHIDAPNSQVRLRDATNSNATMATISFDTDDRKKIAFSCDGSTLKTYADGVLSNTYNLVNVFNVDELRTAAKSFDVHQILTFPTALTDSECIALTTL